MIFDFFGRHPEIKGIDSLCEDLKLLEALYSSYKALGAGIYSEMAGNP